MKGLLDNIRYAVDERELPCLYVAYGSLLEKSDLTKTYVCSKLNYTDMRSFNWQYHQAMLSNHSRMAVQAISTDICNMQNPTIELMSIDRQYALNICSAGPSSLDSSEKKIFRTTSLLAPFNLRRRLHALKLSTIPVPSLNLHFSINLHLHHTRPFPALKPPLLMI